MPGLNDIFAPVADAITAGRIPGAVLGVLETDGTQRITSAGMAALVPGGERCRA